MYNCLNIFFYHTFIDRSVFVIFTRTLTVSTLDESKVMDTNSKIYTYFLAVGKLDTLHLMH